MNELNRALVTCTTEWSAFRRDPVWCMRWLELAAEWLHENKTFAAYEVLVHIINDRGMRASPSLPVDCFADAFDQLIQLGWIVRVPNNQWMSLL